jgi:MSHA pilin protein MshD
LRYQRGFTLIELVIAIVILGFVSLILIPFVTSVTHSPDPVIRQKAVALGQAMMDEIAAKKWDENTPNGGGPICSGESGTGRGASAYTLACPELVKNASAIGAEIGESRATYDDVDDYDGLTASGNFFDQSGSAFSLPGYSRSVRVTYIASAPSAAWCFL